MNEMLVTGATPDEPTISGRELHEKLEIETPYHKWFPRMCEYGFVEGTDFNTDKNVRVQKEGNREVSREITDHHLTIDMAKEICMLQRSEQGKAVRRYLLDLEKQWNTPEAVMSRALRMADAKLTELNSKMILLEAENKEMLPKALFADAVTASPTSILVGDLAKLLKQNGADIGQRRLFNKLREDGYLMKQRGVSWNMPTQRSVEAGWFEIREKIVKTATGDNKIVKTPLVTGKGQMYFVNKYATVKA